MPKLPMTLREFPAPSFQRQAEPTLDQLQRSHDDLSQRVDVLQKKVDRATTRLLQNLEGLEEKLRALKLQQQKQQRVAQTAVTRTQEQLDALTTSTRLQQVNTVVGTVQATAFGVRDDMFATNNLVLAGNQLFWGFLEQGLRTLGVVEGTTLSPAAWFAPVGTLLTAQVALGNKQHERLVSGVATFDGSSAESVQSLRGEIADDLWPDFQQRTDVPVTTSAMDESVTPTSAKVKEGFLRITIESGEGTPPSGRVAWVIDTGVGGG
jgi:hypothetical protein